MPRPTQLSRLYLWIGGLALAASFASGILLWLADLERRANFEPPAWAHWARLAHGWLTPVLCCAFGYLLHHHIPRGWQMRANRWSGAALTVLCATLIVTGFGLYYSNWRAFFFWTHLVLGLLLVPALAGHWLGARKWSRNFKG